MHKRTISLKLSTSLEQSQAFSELQKEFNAACNFIVPIAKKHRCWNRVNLHKLSYYPTRSKSKLKWYAMRYMGYVEHLNA